MRHDTLEVVFSAIIMLRKYQFGCIAVLLPPINCIFFRLIRLEYTNVDRGKDKSYTFYA